MAPMCRHGNGIKVFGMGFGLALTEIASMTADRRAMRWIVWLSQCLR